MSRILASDRRHVPVAAVAVTSRRCLGSSLLPGMVFFILLIALSAPAAWGESIPPGKYRGIYHVDRWGQPRFGFQYVSPDLHDQLKDLVGRPIEVNATGVEQQMNPGGSMISKIEGIERLAEPVEIAVGWLRPKEGPTEILRQVLPGSTVRLKAKVTNRSDEEIVLDSDTFVLALDAHRPPSPSYGSHHVSYPSLPKPGVRTWSFCRDQLPLLPQDQEMKVSSPVHHTNPRLENPPRLAAGKSLEWTITIAGWWPNEYELGVLYRAPRERADRLGRAPAQVEVSSNWLRLDVLADDLVGRTSQASATVGLELADKEAANPAKPVRLRVLFTNTRGKRLRFGLYRGDLGPDLSGSLLCFDREGTLLPIAPGERRGTDNIRLEPGKTHEVLVEAPAGTVMARVAFFHPFSFTDKREDEQTLEHAYISSPTLRIGRAKVGAHPLPAAVSPPLEAAHFALLNRLMDEGSAAALLELTHDLTVAEISQIIESLPAELAPMTASGDAPAQQVLHQAENRYYNLPSLAVDSKGVAHLAFEQLWLDRRREWSRQVFHAQRENDRWSEPAPFLENPLSISGMRLFIDRGDCLYLICHGFRKTDPMAYGIDQFSSDAFLCRREPGQPWSEPESCITNQPRMMRGADACFDAQGALHVVWAHWRGPQHLERLHHRVRGPAGWSEETVLPGIGRNLLHPRLRLLGGQLHVFVSGQSDDNRDIGAYHCVLLDDGWTEPELLVDGTRFDHAMSPPGDRFLFGVHAGDREWDKTFRLFQASDDGRLTQFARFTVPGSPSTGRWSTMSIGWGPLDTPYGLAAQSGNLYLLRVAQDGGTEAVWLSMSTLGDNDVHQPQLLIAGNRYHAAWIHRVLERSTVHSYESPIPADGWLPIEKLLWRTRRGVGLTTADRWFLSDLAYREAQALEADDLPRAIHRYFYIIANLGFAEATWSRERVLELEKDQLELLRSELHSLVQHHPEYLTGDLHARRTLVELTTRWDVRLE